MTGRSWNRWKLYQGAKLCLSALQLVNVTAKIRLMKILKSKYILILTGEENE